ncbi:MAG TPA: serine hydrolase domain-containing protein, partial [Cyclobacteriaceae bacterium]|nr:serine hydrolase domain-containing protein [Cyclobacteriaceae bacterium]
MIRSRYLLIAAITLAGCQSQKTESITSGIVTESVKARIDSSLNAMIQAGKIAGASALIVENDKEVYFNAFGAADRELNKPFDRNTIVRIFSMTKPITGVALMQL